VSHNDLMSAGWKRLAASVFILVVLGVAGAAVGCGGLIPDFQLAQPDAAQDAAAACDPAASESGIGVVTVQELPPEARTTLDLIDSNGPFPYSRDGTVFHNYEGLLPRKPDRYYHEYTVVTPGSSDRGARRIIAGQCEERYYTDDHYNSFRLVVE
jgi:ribonuclease T1